MKVKRRCVFTSIGGLLLIGRIPPGVSAKDSEETEETIKDLIDGFGKEIHEETERNPEFLEEATEALVALDRIDVEKFNGEIGDTDEQIRRLSYTLDIFNTEFDAGIPTQYLDFVDEKIGSVSKYLPVVAASQNVLNCADEYQLACDTGDEDKIEGAKEDLIISALLLICEICLFQTSTTYRLSFMGTRYVANRGLVRIRNRVGNRTYALILSEVHWAIRGTAVNAQKYAAEKSGEILSDLESELNTSGSSGFDGFDRRQLEAFEREELDYEYLTEAEESVNSGLDRLRDELTDFDLGFGSSDGEDGSGLSWP